MIAILADSRLQAVILIQQASKLAFAVLSETFLLLKHVAKLLVLTLQHLVLAAHL